MSEINENAIELVIRKEIESPLAALVSRLRRCANEKVSTKYIDEARVNFENALASAIVKAIKENERKS